MPRTTPAITYQLFVFIVPVCVCVCVCVCLCERALENFLAFDSVLSCCVCYCGSVIAAPSGQEVCVFVLERARLHLTQGQTVIRSGSEKNAIDCFAIPKVKSLNIR